ncbi:conserved hypothetical protein [Paraburkholderia piptadeniae]|uniref:Uncharacterized protein n=1 Tax=Paraburkholderia piptadeniae TaxID=1701573 RepID=A0A1N7SRS2_9BURK|nr:hypothetical protein [Paraburkholderia piptadeniae]SIT50098.1 conserved hypothetical protein [Paraburkholderia piptadeniae]
MTNAIHAVRQFQPFSEYLREGKKPPSNPHVEKAVLMPIEPSSHVVISQEGSRRLAAEQQAGQQQWDWEI